MVIYISQFVYSERFECFVAEAYVDDIRFGIFVDHIRQTIQIRTPNGVEPSVVEDALGDYADVLIDQIAEQLGWKEV